jgi:hypothetical protein
MRDLIRIGVAIDASLSMELADLEVAGGEL